MEQGRKLLHEELTREIIQAFYSVYNELGFGFLEKVYQNSLLAELRSRKLSAESQKQIRVYYKSLPVGEYYADIIVNDLVILELKAADLLIPEFEYQLINYLKATHIEIGLVLNFGPKPEFRRKIYHNILKPYMQKQ